MRTVRNRLLMSVAWLLVVGLGGGCVASDTKPAKTGQDWIKGSIWYRERMLLPPTAEIYVALEDGARMDVAADIIASTRFTPKGGPPYEFSLAYDPARINDKGRYGLRVRIEADGRLMFINTQHVPAFDRPEGKTAKIMVSRVGNSSLSANPDADLVNTYWKLTELAGKPAAPGAGKKELHIVFEPGMNRARGFSGCNQFSGTYMKKANQLKFGPMAATMMACVEGMQQEQAFLQALGKTTRYTIKGDSLALYSGGGKAVLRFKAAHLK